MKTKKKNSVLSIFDNTKADIYPYYIYLNNYSKDVKNNKKCKETKKLYDSLALHLKDLSTNISNITKIPVSNFRFFWDGIWCLEYGPSNYTPEHSISLCVQVKLHEDSWKEASTINPHIPQTQSNNCIILYSSYRLFSNICQNEISINNLNCRSFSEDDNIIEIYKNVRNNNIINIMQNFLQITPKIVSKEQVKKFYAANTHVIFTGE